MRRPVKDCEIEVVTWGIKMRISTWYHPSNEIKWEAEGLFMQIEMDEPKYHLIWEIKACPFCGLSNESIKEKVEKLT